MPVLNSRIIVRCRFEGYDAETQRLLWVREQNSSVILHKGRLAQLWSAFGLTPTSPDTSICPIDWYFRARGFVFMAVGTGSDSTDPDLNGLVNEIDDSERQVDHVSFSGWDDDSSSVTVRQIYQYGTEVANDSTISEWGLFCPVCIIHPVHGVTTDRYFLNRNHLTVPFWKDSTMIVRALVTITVGF